jgi:hypothetical protein
MRSPRQCVLAVLVACASAVTACGSGNSAPSGDDLPPDAELYDEPPGALLAVDTTSEANTHCTYAGRDAEGNTVERQGSFVFGNMTTRLRDFPALQEATGLAEVTNCDEAGRFADGYSAYSEANPGFDDPPVEPPPAGLPLEEDVEAAIEKIYRGQSTVNFPVVELRRYDKGLAKFRGPCTGFFISQHFIATANHCVNDYTRHQKWDWFQVARKNAVGSYTWLRNANGKNEVLLFQYKYPGWMGIGQNFSDSGRDFALLYVDPKVHGQLPRPRDTSPVVESAMRVSTGSLTSGTPFSVWGWGATDTYSSAPRDLFTAPEIFGVTAVTPSFFSAQATSNGRTCEGDSGGPAARVIGGNYVAIGGHVGKVPPGPNVPERCPEVGDQLQWTRTADKRTFIQDVLRTIYGSPFKCGGVAQPCRCFGAGADAFIKCW